MPPSRTYLFLLIAIFFAVSGCEGGLEPPPPEPEPTGAISGTVIYTGDWPPADQFRELIFVPLTFTPTDFTQILGEFIRGNLRSSDRLQTFVDSEEFFVGELDNGVYVYNIIANQFGPNALSDWRPLGVYEENDGLIMIEGDTVEVTIYVDFDNLPPFPPEQ
ncbi:MAG: hypothetical protein JJU37_04405 [Balneolaceae bacterium]|nr:hypothetical protein [Balneolaceae bacterium]